MSSPTFTPVPADKADGDPNPPADMNNTSNQLAAIGSIYSVMNTTYGGGADPTGVTDSTAQIGSAIAAGYANRMPVLLPGGTFSVDAALNWKLPGLQVIGAGSGNTKILQKTANTPIIQVAGQGQLIQGLTLSYGSQQASGQTSANCIQFGDDSVGSCFESKFSDLYCELGYTPLAVNPALVTSAGIFSCLFENIHVLGYYQHAIGLSGNAGGGNANCTGCCWNNTYIHNNYSGSAAAANSYPLYLESWDETVFNQLNIEHGESFILDLIGLSAVGNCVINDLHIESMQLSGSSGNAGYINVDSKSAVTVNGLSVRFSTMSGTVSNPVVRFSGAGPSVASITGFNEPSDNTFSHAHPYADFGSVASSTIEVSNILVSQATAPAINIAPGNNYQIGAPNVWTPQSNLLLTATGDPVNATTSNAVVFGDLYLMQLPVDYAMTLSHLWFLVAGAGGGTSNGSFVGLYNSGGTRITGSSDIGSSFTSTGSPSLALTTAQLLPAGPFVWGALLLNLSGTASVTLRSGVGTTGSPANVGLTAAEARWALNGTGLSALPSTVTPASNNLTGLTFWCGGS